MKTMLKLCITSSRNPLALFGLLLGASLLAGCGGGATSTGPTRYAVSGKITLDGEPVPAGEIHFFPSGNNGAGKTQTLIAKGNYAASGETNGHLGGKYRIQIFGFDGASNPTNNDKGFPLWEGPYEVDREFEASDLEGIDFDISRDEVGPVPEHDEDPWEDT